MSYIPHDRLTVNGEIILTIRVHPGAPKSKLKGVMIDGTLKVDVAAVPEDGKANAELISFLAKEFGVPKSHVTILRGQTGKKKVVRVRRDCGHEGPRSGN